MAYNGWKNRETWLVNLWAANDEGAYRHIKELVAKGEMTKAVDFAIDFAYNGPDGPFNRRNVARRELRESFKEF